MKRTHGLNIHLLLILIIMSFSIVSCVDTIPDRTITNAGSSTGGSDDGGDDDDDDDKIIRPTGAVKFKTNFCGCKDSKPITYGDCSSFCSGKNTNGASLFFFEFTTTEAISLDPTFGNVYGWCNNIIDEEAETNPSCVLQAKDENGGVVNLTLENGANGNSFFADIGNNNDRLLQDKVYILSLIEQSSGAKSDSVQIVKYAPSGPSSNLGTLKVAPITQYSCIYRPPSTDSNTGEVYYDAAFRIHYYFLPRNPPDPMPAGADLICHDFLNPIYGMIDHALYPRLDQKPSVFNLWDSTDPRFYNNDGNQYIDINEHIIAKARNFGATGLSDSINFFQPFPVLSSASVPDEDGGNNSSTAQSMGYYMAPWIDQNHKAYCLNNTHYNSSNPLFKAMKDIIGVEMEGIYVGVKTLESVRDRDGNYVTAPSDFILVRESEIKQAWFYLSGSTPTLPTDANIATKPIYFYYPINPASPYIQSSNQKLYQVKGAQELNNVSTGGSNESGGANNYPPHDRRIGCIPKL